MQRRKFSREFKLEAVRLVKDRGVAVAQAARDLDLHENVLRKWIRETSAEPAWLPANIALSVALAFHELTTNAIKYGSLSNAIGMVSVCWKVVCQKQHRRLELEWREQGGPPVGTAGRKGFGTQLLNRVFDSGPSDRVTLKFETSGLVCDMRVTLSRRDEGVV